MRKMIQPVNNRKLSWFFKTLTASIAVISLSHVAFAQEAPWKKDRVFDLSLKAGTYDSDTKNYSVRGEYSGLGKWRIGASYSTTDNESSNSSSNNVYVSSDISAPWVGRLTYSASDKADIIDSRDLELALGWNTGNWYLETSLVKGELDLGNPDFAPEVVTILNDIGVLSAERDGFTFSATYFSSSWVLSATYGNYEYERDGELTQATLFQALQQLTPQQRTDIVRDIRNARRATHTLFTRINSSNSYQAYRNTVSLADSEFSVNYTYVFEKVSLGLGYWWTDEMFNGGDIGTYYLSTDYLINSGTTIGALLSSSDDDSELYAEISIRFRW